MMYNSALGVIFGVKKYADALMKVIRERDITVNFQRKLLEVTKDEAIFENIAEETVESYKVCDATPTHTRPTHMHTHTHTHTVRHDPCVSASRAARVPERSAYL